MDEKWVENCLSQTRQTLTKYASDDLEKLEPAIKEICLSALDDAKFGAFFSCIGMAFATASLILSFMRMREFDKARLVGSWVLIIFGLGAAAWGAFLVGQWYLKMSIGVGFALALMFVIWILTAPKWTSRSKEDHPAENGGTT